MESTEMVGAKAGANGKGKAVERPSTRVKEEPLEEKQKLARREVAMAQPHYMTVTRELRQKNKQLGETYCYDYQLWKRVQPSRNPSWLVRGSEGGPFPPKGCYGYESRRRT
jgi:hypothetical protein